MGSAEWEQPTLQERRRELRGRVGPFRRHWADFGPSLLYMLPAFALVAAFTYIPFLRAIYLSFFVVNRNTFQPSHFMGLTYYLRVLNIGDSPFGDIYLRSLLNFLKAQVDSGNGESFGIDGGANSTARDAAFVTGEACITFNSIASLRGYIKSAKDANKGVDVGVAYIPRPRGAKGGVIIGGASLWITSTGTTEQQAGAWDFVKFASTPEIQGFFSSNTGYYPTRKAAYATQDMKGALTLYPQFQIAIDELRATTASPATQGAVFGTFVKARSNVQSAMEQFITGKVPTAKQALDTAARQSSSELAEYNASY